MSRSIGVPIPDCGARRLAVRGRRAVRDRLAERHADSATIANGEETAFDLSYALNYHKGLPHDVTGAVHRASYNDMVRMLCGQEYGAVETLPIGRNRSATNGSDVNPSRYTTTAKDADKPLGYRKLTSPFTGHVFDTQGADAGAFAIAPAPLAESDELAAEMAELYVMALLRDTSFADIAAGSADAASLAAALGGMPFFQANFPTTSDAETRRYAARGAIASAAELFRGSTPGAKAGPVLSQFMLMGSDNRRFTFQRPNDTEPPENPPSSDFVHRFAETGHEDGFVLYGTQIIDQRSIVAMEGVDYLTSWEAWLDCQNGVDFNDLDVFRHRRRFLSTPRDIATYVHYDALYQAYLNACLIMLGDGKNFPKDAGLPETTSRTRSAFASFGGPHVLSLVTEVATRALKAVWRQKWLHHRRIRPEALAGLITLEANAPDRIENDELRERVAALRGKIPDAILQAVQAHNAAQNANATPAIEPKPAAELPGDFPQIAAAQNFLLPMAFPEGSPTHPAYGAGHATVAGACITVLKACFEMFEADGKPRLWPYRTAPGAAEQVVYQASSDGSVLQTIPGLTEITVQGELDKLAANVAIARNMAGVHYFTDYYESLRLGERIAVSILEDQLSLYGEPVSMRFTSFDGELVRISSNGDEASLRIANGEGLIPPEEWLSRYAA